MINKLIKIYKKYEEIINYAIIGVLTTVISLAIYYALVYTVLDPNKPIELQIANILAWIVAVTFAYITNRIIVFKSKSNSILKEAVKFYSARIVTLLFDMAFMFATVTWFSLNDKVMKIVSNVIIIVLNYVLSKFLVFNEKKGNKK